MTENILSTDNLSKKFGKRIAVNNLTLEVDRGQVFGLLGPNGSGKTTTLGILLDVIRPTSGSYRWFGQKPSSGIRRMIGAILETPSFYPYLSGSQNLRVVAEIKQCSKERIDEVLAWVGLSDRKHDQYRKYSLGMKQRLAIAAALLPDPPVLILDEPTNGLDPSGIAEIRELIIEISRQGKTLILASHLLDEVQKVCSHFAILKNGHKIHDGKVSEALNTQNSVEVMADDFEKLRAALSEWPHNLGMKTEGAKLLVDVNGSVTSADLNQYLLQKNIVVSHLAQLRSNLEKEFLKILSEHDDPPVSH